MTIVMLLVSFTLYSVLFFRGHIKNELITYNNANLKNTTENYEATFQLIENSVLTFSLNEKVTEFNKPEFNYASGSQLMDELQIFLANQSLFLENMIVYYEKSGVTLEKSRGADADVMFGRYYVSQDYSYDFWKAQFDAPYVTRILPNSVFSELVYADKLSSSQVLIPIVVKNNTNPSVYIIAFADAHKLFATYHQSINDNFYILDETQQLFFATGAEQKDAFPAFEGNLGYVKQGKNYYFYKKGESTGLIYVNVIPDDSIASQMKWNYTFVALFVFAVIISILASFLFSVRLNRPVKRLVHSIQQLTNDFPWQKHSGIKEFNIIQEKVQHLLDSNWDINQTLEEKNSLLRHLAYINELRNIRSNGSYLNDLIDINEPYRFVLFKLTFKPRLFEEIDVNEDRATSYIMTYINKVVSERFQESLTLQIENDQLLSVVYSEQGSQRLLETLNEIRQVLDLDREYCFLTIALSKRHDPEDDFKMSFDQTKSLLQYRKYNDKTQILSATDAKPTNYYLMPAQEEEINVNLNNGNEAQIIQFVKRELGVLKKKEASEKQVKAFISNIVDRVKRAFLFNKLDVDVLKTFQDCLQNNHTFEDLEQLFEEWLPQIADLIRGKKEKEDYITSFVFDHLEKHYAHDITLEMMADKLNLSRSYLSTYFKEKTGIYFVDYVNMFRVDRAKELLSGSDVKIQDAAAKVGYQNINSFNRMFKKFTGVTPSEFRKVERLK
ncbi:helix-turn-helix domain-containing protein [Paenibacillus sp. HB172176]|uniref:helix-turn-helix domain-containing protein n=1 Tax=Paenibacillus sp. HB172176 TaxID=2493690 RepID=UPI00143C6D7F|nr:helix-turn-helix domain-containing protein [Paenibacillus sp. HB172176]